jgi:hypothetical protein
VKLGMVVRDDSGGLGNLTWQAWRSLAPDVTVVVEQRPSRGIARPERFDRGTVHRVGNPVPGRFWSRVAREADVWWTAETWYCPDAETRLRAAGCRTAMYVMPEYFVASDADALWNPTPWLHDRLPARAVVMPCPMDPPGDWEPRTGVRRLLHVTSSAAHDRNGTVSLLAALPYLRAAEVEVLVHQPDTPGLVDPSRLAVPSGVTVRTSNEPVDDLADLYRWADMLVLPRRYAGLCLPAQEAMGHGCLVAMPNVEPQMRWPIVALPATAESARRFRSFRVPVCSVPPRQLARVLDGWISATAAPVTLASRTGRAWVEENAWSRWAPVWLDSLEGL